MNCVHGIRMDRSCKHCILGSEGQNVAVESFENELTRFRSALQEQNVKKTWDLLKYFNSSQELKLVARLLKIKQEYNIDISQPALEGDEVAWYKKAKMKSLYFYYDETALNNLVMVSMHNTLTDEIINPTNEQIAKQMNWILE